MGDLGQKDTIPASSIAVRTSGAYPQPKRRVEDDEENDSEDAELLNKRDKRREITQKHKQEDPDNNGQPLDSYYLVQDPPDTCITSIMKALGCFSCCSDFLAYCCTYFALTIFSSVVIAIDLWAIYVGFTLNDATCEKRFPLWLEVWGLLGFAQLLVGALQCGMFRSSVLYVMHVMCIAWLITGTVWINGLDYNKHQCDNTVFLTTFWIITGEWMFLCITGCVALTCWLCLSALAND